MIKKIKIEQLKPGMFVHDFNCGWMEHPFFRNRMMIKNEEMIQKVASVGVRELYIDTSRGMDVRDAPEKTEVNHVIQAELHKIAEEKPKVIPKVIEYVPVKEEMLVAKQIKDEAKKSLTDIMDNA